MHILKNAYFILFFWGGPVQQSRTINLVIYEKTAMSSSTVGHEDDGYTHSNVTSLLFASIKNEGIVEHTPFCYGIPENEESVRGSMKNDEKKVVLRGGFAKKNMCVSCGNLFSRKKIMLLSQWLGLYV
jgi:hypothetical protein